MKRINFTTANLAKEVGYGLDGDTLLTNFYQDGIINNDGKPEIYVAKKYIPGRSPYGMDTIDDFEAKMVDMDNSMEDIYLAPYQAELQSWLRNEHKLNVIVDFYDNSKYYGYESVVYDSKNREFHDEDMTDQATPNHVDGVFNTYEDALEEGLLQALKIVIDAK